MEALCLLLPIGKTGDFRSGYQIRISLAPVHTLGFAAHAIILYLCSLSAYPLAWLTGGSNHLRPDIIIPGPCTIPSETVWVAVCPTRQEP